MRFVFVIINIILLGFVAFFGVDIMYKGIETALTDFSMNAAFQEPAAVSETIQHTVSSEKNYEQISRRNIFNVLTYKTDGAKETPETTYRDIAHLKATRLELELLGTVTGSAVNDYAVIEDKRKREQSLYQVGDKVQNALIKNILRHRVVLNYEGEDQVLEMDFAGGRRAENPPAVIEERSASKNLNINRSVLEKSFDNVNDLMKQVRVRPHFDNGKPDGLKLYSIRNGSIFQKMGLQNGDIIKGVDGKEIETVDDALDLYKNLKNESNLILQIERDGRTEEIHYYVQ